MNKKLLRETLMGEGQNSQTLGSYAKKGKWPSDLQFYDEVENLHIYFSHNGDIEIGDKRGRIRRVSGTSVFFNKD